MAQQRELTRLFHFTDDDLRRNQAGNLTARQLEAANTWVRQAPIAGVAFVVFWAVFTLALNSFVPNALLLMLLVGAVLFGLGVYWYRGMQAALENPQVRQASGPIRLQRSVRSGTAAGRGEIRTTRTTRVSYYLHIDGQRFAVSQQAFRQLDKDSQYRVYYLDLRFAKRILSVEALHKHSAPDNAA